jgi:hypothetical protein
VRWFIMAFCTSAIVKGLTGKVGRPGAVSVRTISWFSVSNITRGYGRNTDSK